MDDLIWFKFGKWRGKVINYIKMFLWKATTECENKLCGSRKEGNYIKNPKILFKKINKMARFESVNFIDHYTWRSIATKVKMFAFYSV